MKTIKSVSLTLTNRQTKAIHELRQRLNSQFEIKGCILFGSVARGEEDKESDLDILILTASPFTRFKRHKITDIVFEINLKFSTNISTLVIDIDSWQTGDISVLPIHDHILEEGVRL